METWFRINLIIIASTCYLVSISAQQAFEKLRRDMVSTQIEYRGISDPATLEAMRSVERHLFVPKNNRGVAYADRAVPIGYGQTISQPYIVAYMTEIISPKPDFKVLEIGTGSGYQAAILAGIVDSVYTIEIIEELGKQASNRLSDLGYKNVVTKIADGYYGWEKRGPFDAILVTAAAAFIPPPLIQQLKPNGTMVIPIGSPFLVQNLMLVNKRKGKVRTKNLFPVRFVPFTRQ